MVPVAHSQSALGAAQQLIHAIEHKAELFFKQLIAIAKMNRSWGFFNWLVTPRPAFNPQLEQAA